MTKKNYVNKISKEKGYVCTYPSIPLQFGIARRPKFADNYWLTIMVFIVRVEIP